MGRSAILSRIHACNRQIADTRGDISRLEGELEDLYALLSKLNLYSDDFIANIGARRVELAVMDNYRPTTRTAGSYQVMMSGELHGTGYSNVTAKIGEFQADIDTAIKQVQSEIEERRNTLSYLESRLRSLEYQYSRCED
jgi:uncharacterized coiled-coil protein SlyX